MSQHVGVVEESDCTCQVFALADGATLPGGASL